jgi:hypothetical protein
MALNKLTKVQTLGIGSNIEVVGVITTGQFKSGTSNLHASGVELTNLNVSGIATIGGNVSIGGTLTYQDVTNIDSVGLITARSGINVSGGTATFAGNIDANGDLDVDGHTNLDNVSIAGITTFSGQGIRIENATNPFIHLKDTTNNTDSYVSTDDGGSLYLKADDNQEGSSSKIVFQVDGSEKIHIESGSGLKFTGKGTSIPVGGILHHTNNNLYVRGGTNGLILGNQDNTNTIQIYNGYIKFETNDGSEKLRILADGKVGIGTVNPVALTHIYDLTNTSTATEQFRISGGNRTADNIETGFRFFTESPTINGNRHVRFTSNGNTGLIIQPYETSTGNAAVDRTIDLCPSGGRVEIGANGSAFGQLSVSMPSQAGGAALQVMNTNAGSGDNTLTNTVLRSVNNSGSNWAHAEYRASSHIFAYQGTQKFTVNSNGAGVSGFITASYFKSSGPGGGSGIRLEGLAAGSGSNWVDTGISVNQGNASATMLVIGSRNTSDQQHVQGYAWLLRFAYNGNHLPAVHNITGNSAFWSIRVSSSNTLEINGNAGNWQFGGIWVT